MRPQVGLDMSTTESILTSYPCYCQSHRETDRELRDVIIYVRKRWDTKGFHVLGREWIIIVLLLEELMEEILVSSYPG